MIWIREGQSWRIDGSRQAQFEAMLFVPKQMAAATMLPTKYATLKSDVRTGRSFG